MAIVRACIEDMRSKGIDQWDDVYPNQATLEADIASGTLYIALQQGVGCGLVVLDDRQAREYEGVVWHYCREKIAVVHRLMIDPSVQGQGLAGRVMDFVEEEAQRQGYGAIRLDAFSRNPSAIRLYTRRNYRMAGTVVFRKGVFHCFERDLFPKE